MRKVLVCGGEPVTLVLPIAALLAAVVRMTAGHLLCRRVRVLVVDGKEKVCAAMAAVSRPRQDAFPPDFRLCELADPCERPAESGARDNAAKGPSLGPSEPAGDYQSGIVPEEGRAESGGLECQRSESVTEVEGGSVAGPGCRDSRDSGGRLSRAREQSDGDLRKIKTSIVGGTQGRTSVRDRIALFSSPSVETLTAPRVRLMSQNSIDSQITGVRSEHVRAQERSKSDLKLTGNETQRSRSRDDVTKRKKISDPSGARFGSLGNMHVRGKSGDLSPSTESCSSQHSLPLPTSHSRDSSTGRSESSGDGDVGPSPLAERSQSLLDLGRVEKRHSYAGMHNKGYGFHGAVSDLPRKTSLNAITEERKKSVSKLRGLVIPSKVDGVSKKGPADMPAIRSRELPVLARSKCRLQSPVASPRARRSTSERPEPRHLASPPWKTDSAAPPIYSPAFKRKNVSVSRSPSPGSSAFRSVSSSSRLGGSSIELSRAPSDPSPSGRRHDPRTSRPPQGSTLTLVDEPLEEAASEPRSREGSVEFDHRASTSTLHGSPVKEIDVEEEFVGAARTEAKKEEVVLVQTTVTKSVSAKTAVVHDRLERVSGSPPKIQEDGAWRRFASPTDSGGQSPGAAEELRDLSKLRQSTKPSVKSLKERWQMLSDGGDAPSPVSRSSSVRSERSELTPREPGGSPDPPAAPPAKDAPTSVRDVVDRNWPSIESERADIDRKLSTPSYGEAAAQLRERRGRPSSRPQSWVESERELKLFEMGSMLVGSAVSTSSSQENIMDALDSTKSPSGSTSSLLEMLTANLKRTARSRHVLSVSDLRRAFERSDGRACHSHMTPLDSNGSESPAGPTAAGSMVSLTSTKDHYGSITSLASSTSLISPHELQQLIEEANQSLEEAGTPSHEIIVAVVHREMLGGSIGITLAGGADYENKEISVNKVITGSVADRDGRIKKGDRVISINGRSMKGTTHREALNTLKVCPQPERLGAFRLRPYRPVALHAAGRGRTVPVHPPADMECFFCRRRLLSPSWSAPVYYSEAPRAEVVLVLSRSRSVTPLDPTPDEAGYHRPAVINTFSSRPPKILESPMDSKSLASALAFEDVPRGPPSVVTLLKEGAGVGFSLEGGKDSPLGDRPLIAKKIFTGGAADKSGKLHVGDEILAINDQDVTHMPRIEAWNFLKKQPEGALRLTIREQLAHGQAPAPSATRPATVLPSGGSEPQRRQAAPPTAGRVGGSRPVIAAVTPKVALQSPEVVLPKA
ncbi:uncharacterized protein LOC119099678 [Pollicipes pollicipes]|uniref:uncharacterized protein LOC119099678 n=1 Tax=Pollicipes pollicipes TaxID=41117 RepID=UPI001885497B|nr:uncharacterized protein LOC119099678 [Pollicipes pollicipes]